MINIWPMAARKLCFYLYAGHTGSESHSLSSYSVPGHSWPPLADLWMIVRYRDCVATVALSVKHEIQPPLKGYIQWQESSQFLSIKKNDTEIQSCLISPRGGKTCGVRVKVMSLRSRGVLHSTEVRFPMLRPCYAFIWLTFWGSLHNSNDSRLKMVQLRVRIHHQWAQQTITNFRRWAACWKWSNNSRLSLQLSHTSKRPLCKRQSIVQM